MSTEYVVRRLDTNPENVATFDTWVRVSNFRTKALADAYVQRAAGPTQRLRVVEEDNGRPVCPNCGQWINPGAGKLPTDCLNECHRRGFA